MPCCSTKLYSPQTITAAIGAAVAITVASGAAPRDGAPAAPDVESRPVEITTNGDTRVDEYAWLREKTNPAVIDYLNEENEYAEAMMAHTDELQQSVYDEILGRLDETDLSVPVEEDGWWYYSRTEEGKDYPFYCRKPVQEGDDPATMTFNGAEEIYLDVNQLAQPYDYYRAGSITVSPDHTQVAWTADTTGYESVDIYIKDLATGESRKAISEDVSPWGLAWSKDGSTLFFSRYDGAKRSNRVFRQELATGKEELVQREDDVKFRIFSGMTLSEDWLIIRAGSSTTSQAWGVPADDPWAEPVEIFPRVDGVGLSDIEHRPGPDGGWFYFLTDADAPDYKVVRAPVGDVSNWEEVIAHEPGRLISGLTVIEDAMVLSERHDGSRKLRIIPQGESGTSSSDGYFIDVPEDVAVISARGIADYDTDTIRFSYESMVTPESIYQFDLGTRERTLLKRENVIGYTPENYVTSRLWAPADDGTMIPISVMHRKGVQLDGDNPTLLYAYGSYGASMEPWFRSSWVSYADRGFVCAVAHVRGGSEMGRAWKEQGRMLNKKNTFTDFIDCAEFMIEKGYTKPERLAIQGGSAGGLLIGAVINMRPDLFKAAHAAVPFVDVVNTMLDASIPLTTGEYEEWGNPNDPVYYEYIKSYSPYDNVKEQDYPNLLITAGLNDPRVHYWEPAKWCAKLRDKATGGTVQLMRTNMGAGHGGASGRYGRFGELAWEMSFIIDQVGTREPAGS